MFDRINEGRWWDFGWQLIEGCTKVSPACANCWSLAKEARFRKETGIVFHSERLSKPLNRKKPASYAIWNDLFHEDVSFSDALEVLFIAQKCPQHIFIILTKRPERMREFFTEWVPNPFFEPLPNVWLGVTAENQEQVDKRIPVLLQIPAAKRFVSIEPMLGNINLRNIDAEMAGHEDLFFIDALTGKHDDMARPCKPVNKLDWVICGSESGPGRRPMKFDWAVSLRDQCVNTGVPFFYKQRYFGNKKISLPSIYNKVWDQIPIP